MNQKCTLLQCSGLFFISILICISSDAQLYNEAGTIRIMNNSSVVCMGSFINASGTVINDGKLEVGGNFDNRNIYNSTEEEDSLLLTGGGNVELNSGSATLNNLQVNKTNLSGVTLTASTTVNKSFNLLAGSFSTDTQKTYELISPVSATFTFASGAEITGKVRRTDWANGNAVAFNQADMRISTSGGTAPVSLLVNMLPDGNPTLSEKEVKRYFYFSAAGGENYTANIIFPYNQQELNSNTEANLVAWYLGKTNKWNEKIAGNAIDIFSHYLISYGIKAGIFANREWKLAEMQYSKNQDLFVYPIPAKNTLNILMTSEKNKNVTIELLDVAGKVCKVEQKTLQNGLNNFNINITTLSSGQYILKVKENNEIQTKVILID